MIAFDVNSMRHQKTENTHQSDSPLCSCCLNCAHLHHIALHILATSVHFKIIFGIQHVISAVNFDIFNLKIGRIVGVLTVLNRY
jgi:hypothetical protein